MLRTADLDFDLPPERIAEEPTPRREDARMLVLDRATGRVEHRTVREWPSLLAAGDLVVLNDTRVLPARVPSRRATGGRTEILFLEPADADGSWYALLRSGGALREGEVLDAGQGAPEDRVRLVRSEGDGRWRVVPVAGTLPGLMGRRGEMPLPPYVKRAAGDARSSLDRERYQTVYARSEGAVAAPTAGLHLTEAMLAEVRARGVRVASVTLHVGLGTFAPVRVERLEDHPMHEEAYVVPPETADAVRETRAAGRRVVAVGTTSVRALEAAALASPDGVPHPGPGRTRILILPGHEFRAIDALLTNFHLPRSTLLALVAAFAGLDRVLAAYREAVARGYRFFSYGDAMFVV